MPKLTAIRKQALDELMKEAFFQATVSVLDEHGVEGMTMDRVAAAAGVAKGSVYNYFDSKKDLLEFVYTKTIDPIHNDLVETIATERTALDKLSRHMAVLLEHVVRHKRVFRLLFEDDTAQGLLVSSQRTTRQAGIERLADIFRQGISEGVFRRGDPLMLASLYFGLCRGFFDSQPDLETPEERECAQRLILGTFLNGIAAEKTPAS